MTELKEGLRPTIGISKGASTSTGTDSGISKGAVQTQKSSKHLYEVDVIRAVTALCVVGVHVVAFALLGTTGPVGELVQYGVKSSLHFTREIFLSISAFVLVMVYGKRALSAKTFWKKRGIGVLFPYIAWSFFYEREKIDGLHLSPLQWTGSISAGSGHRQGILPALLHSPHPGILPDSALVSSVPQARRLPSMAAARCQLRPAAGFLHMGFQLRAATAVQQYLSRPHHLRVPG